MGGGGGAVRVRGGGQKNGDRKILEMTGESGVGVGPEVEDEVERRKPCAEGRRQRSGVVKRGPAGFVLGVGGVEQSTGNREGGGGGVAGEFDAGGGVGGAKGGEGRERDDEIAEGAAAPSRSSAAPRWMPG